MTYTLERSKVNGTATVSYPKNSDCSYQKADSIGRAAFHVPAVFCGDFTLENSTEVVRLYYVPGWNKND